MHDGAAELLYAGEIRGLALVVVIVAAAKEPDQLHKSCCAPTCSTMTVQVSVAEF